MQDAGILDGDLLVVHKTDDARSGQIVVARLGEEVTVKRLKRRGREITLVAENAVVRADRRRSREDTLRHRRRGGGRHPAQPFAVITTMRARLDPSSIVVPGARVARAVFSA